MSTKPLTDDELEAIRAREANATKGPWELWNGCSWWRIGTTLPNGRRVTVIEPTTDRSDSHPNLTGYNFQADALFATHARTDIPALIAEVKRLKSESEWLPIEQAPKDGTELLLYYGDMDTQNFSKIIIARWSREGRWVHQNRASFSYSYDPTHFRRIKAPEIKP